MMKLLVSGTVLLCTVTASAQDAGRLRANESFQCDRDHLTAFTGKVIGYHRTRMGLMIRVRTDESTTEKFSLQGTKSALAKQFQLDGGKFTDADWKKIELSASRTQPKVRITVWQCEKPSARMFDWQLPKK